MRIREVTCSHQRAVIVLEDLEQRFRLTFSADPHEAHRLSREMGRARCTCNPVYDLVQSLLDTFRASMTRVLLDDRGGTAICALVHLRSAGEELALPCYPPDALALALRAKVPIYATAEALVHAEARTALGTLPPGAGQVSHWLERVKPDHFQAG